MDLFELFEPDAPGRDRDVARQPRKGLRGLFDRLAAALDGDADDSSRDGKHRDRERRHRDGIDSGFD